MNRPIGSRWWRLLSVLLALTLVAAACSSDDDGDVATDDTTGETTDDTTGDDDGTDGPAPDGIVVQAGINDPDDPTIAVTEFMPEAVTVPAGETVSWQISGPEPHSVTFLPEGEEAPSPESPEAEELFAPTPHEGAFDGSATANSGLFPLGPAEEPMLFELSFAEPGEYSYFCVIHPLMTGTVTVVEEGEEGDTPEDVAARGQEEQDEWLAEGRAAKEALVGAETATETNDDGSTNWLVEMGTTTEHTDIVAFAPVPVEVTAGDTVTFVNNSMAPHTATFLGDSGFPEDPLSEENQAPSGDQPLTLDASSFANSGWLPPAAPPDAPPPEEVRRFTFAVPDAGEFAYVCLLHVPSGMVGNIVVS